MAGLEVAIVSRLFIEFTEIKMRTKSILAILLVVCTVGVAIGQHKKKIEQVKGEWVVSNDITLIQARENGINQAKLEALRQAGVPEIISESNLMYHSDKPE